MNKDDVIQLYGKQPYIWDMSQIKRIVELSPISANLLKDAIDKFGMATLAATNGFITPSGVLYTCNWGVHELVLDVMGLRLRAVEEAGWVRVSLWRSDYPAAVMCNLPLTRAQLRTLEKMDEGKPFLAATNPKWMPLRANNPRVRNASEKQWDRRY